MSEIDSLFALGDGGDVETGECLGLLGIWLPARGDPGECTRPGRHGSG